VYVNLINSVNLNISVKSMK